ncbi:DNA repair protein RecO [Methylobacillus gramineus]|uniref:DNA repair protein RecO n=1 Tax=Methylobacillus gramineus TaxID=755169 RepID=UPI001D00064A|nr:DNA repair protein RecO [Methylobacillus gramineus]MCB5184793.1 DNA repair protein RecO [Methylobacillus gramineus]
MAVSINRQDNQPVYVLHTYPFKETSLVVELFSREFGRVAAVAKGARRPRSAMRGMLQAFQPLQATWSGKAELKNLHSMEWGSGLLLLQGEALMCGFYLNELLLRLLPREDAHDALFDYYHQTLRILARNEVAAATTLRRFELKMLQEMGYAVPLMMDEHGQPTLHDQLYHYIAEHGAVAADAYTGAANGVQLSGKTLLDMAQDDYTDAQTQQQSKQLMRLLLAHYLGDKPLHTRQLLMDLQAL